MKKILRYYQNLNKAIKASIWFLICSFMQKGISTITTPIFTRLMSVAEYGQYSVFNSWLGIVTIFVSLHLYSGTYTQGLIKYSEDKKVYISALEGLLLSIVASWTVIYLLFRTQWNRLFQLTTVQMLAMLVLIWTTSVFNFWAAEQRVNFEYRKLVLITIAVSLAKPVVGIFFVKNADDKVTARILGLALVELMGYTSLFLVQMAHGKTFFSKKYWKHALLLNLPLVPHYLSETVLNSSDRLMINAMIGAEAAGIYSLAYSISQIMTLFNKALSQTVSPWIFQKIKGNSIGDIDKISIPLLGMIAIFNLALIAFAPEIVAIFAPSNYHEAIWVIPPIAMSVYFMFMYSLFSTVEFYFEKTKWIAAATMVGAILNIILNYLLIPVFGYCAAGYTTLVCYMVYAICHYMFMRKICDEYLSGNNVFNIGRICILTIAFGIVGFTFLMLYNNILIRYALVGLLIIMVAVFRKKIMCIANQFMGIRKMTRN